MIRGCGCEVCARRRDDEEQQRVVRPRLNEEWGLPEGSSHELEIRIVDRKEEMIVYRMPGKPFGTVLTGPMVAFKGLRDGAATMYGDKAALTSARMVSPVWRDLDWDPSIRL